MGKREGDDLAGGLVVGLVDPAAVAGLGPLLGSPIAAPAARPALAGLGSPPGCSDLASLLVLEVQIALGPHRPPRYQQPACERIAVMYAGRIVEEGPATGVFEAPAHPYTRALGEAFPTIGDRASRHNPHGLGGDPPDPRELPSGCEFHPRCPVSVAVCPTLDVELWPAGPARRAACVHVRDGHPELVRQVPPRPVGEDTPVHPGAAP